jgi:hypothetical protein
MKLSVLTARQDSTHIISNVSTRQRHLPQGSPPGDDPGGGAARCRRLPAPPRPPTAGDAWCRTSSAPVSPFARSRPRSTSTHLR